MRRDGADVLSAAGLLQKFFPGPLKNRRIIDQLFSCLRQDFRGVHHPFQGGAAFSLGSHLPGVGGGAGGDCGRGKLRGGHDKAHVAHVGRTGDIDVQVGMLNDEVRHQFFPVQPGVMLLFPVREEAYADVSRRVNIPAGVFDCLCEGELLFSIFRERYLLHALKEQVLKDGVGEGAAGSFVKQDLHFCFRHHGGALCNFVYSFIQGADFLRVCGADEVQDFRVILHDVRRGAAGVQDGVMDPVRRFHVLSQIVHADVHQFHGVKGASAEVGRRRGMAGRTVKAVADLAVGHEGTGQDCVPAAGVPGECCGELIKDTFSGHVSLSGTAFFSRTAEKHDGPRFPAFFQIVSQKERRPCGGASKEIVAAAVSIPCPGAGPRFRNACFLGKTGEGVVLPEEADDRIALAPGGGKCRLHSGDPPGHQETFRLQK